MTTGNWSFNEQTNYLEIWDQKGDLIKKFKILSLQKELMEVLEERI